MKDPVRLLLAYRIVLIAIAHVALVVASYLCAIFLRFEFRIPQRDAEILFAALPVLIACRLTFFARYGLFRGWWQYVGVRDVVDILKSTTAGSLAFVLVIVLAGAFPGFPRSLVILEWTLTLHFLAGARVVSRLSSSLIQRLRIRARNNVLIVGSGSVAEATLRELMENPSDRWPIGILDDGEHFELRRLRGVPVLGRYDEIERVLRDEKPGEVLIAMPSDQEARIRSVVRHCRAAGVRFRIVPSVREHLDQPRPWDFAILEQLLEEERKDVFVEASHELFRGRTVLIVGAGGTIGSALAGRIAGAEPRHLLLFDRNESPLYYLEVEFLKAGRAVPVTPLIGDLLDEERLRRVVAEYRPDIVLHAAGYTRLELLAENEQEVRENNLGGTRTLLRICDDLEVSKLFVLSCDERRNDFVACLHRAAERLLRRAPGQPSLLRAAIRFPSVLGSPGCPVTEIARHLRDERTIPFGAGQSIRVAPIGGTVELVIGAMTIAEAGDVLSVQSGRDRTVEEVLRTLSQVWNLPEVPVRTTILSAPHLHAVEPARATSHPRILRRDLSGPPAPCSLALLGRLDELEAGGALLEGTHSR